MSEPVAAPSVGLAAPADMDHVRALFRAYAGSVDAPACFDGFEKELASLPGDCAAPLGGILLARDPAGAAPQGVVAFHPIAAGIAEMRRLYVRPPARGRGWGRLLVQAALVHAASAGHRVLRLSTVPAAMPAADALYRAIGFCPIPPYPGTAAGCTCFEKLL
jgi:GNAT superfamily N-acetyltransferase